MDVYGRCSLLRPSDRYTRSVCGPNGRVNRHSTGEVVGEMDYANARDGTVGATGCLGRRNTTVDTTAIAPLVLCGTLLFEHALPTKTAPVGRLAAGMSLGVYGVECATSPVSAESVGIHFFFTDRIDITWFTLGRPLASVHSRAHCDSRLF